MSVQVAELQFAASKLTGYLKGLITAGGIEPDFVTELNSRIDDVSFANSNISTAQLDSILALVNAELGDK